MHGTTAFSHCIARLLQCDRFSWTCVGFCTTPFLLSMMCVPTVAAVLTSSSTPLSISSTLAQRSHPLCFLYFQLRNNLPSSHHGIIIEALVFCICSSVIMVS
ncbi:hypothetical protein N431DRAFT_122509 [Stipitochalara longipes BDJ]|nr:hypothetical protein N431DRAFT_122509 [Stipitochalara longipes BDJ]